MTVATANKTEKCPRCNGKGHMKTYSHIASGVCFKCGGSGEVKRITRKVSKPVVRKNNNKFQIAFEDERVWNSPRMSVTKEHPQAKIHAYEVYQWHERNGWSAS